MRSPLNIKLLSIALFLYIYINKKLFEYKDSGVYFIFGILLAFFSTTTLKDYWILTYIPIILSIYSVSGN